MGQFLNTIDYMVHLTWSGFLPKAESGTQVIYFLRVSSQGAGVRDGGQQRRTGSQFKYYPVCYSFRGLGTQWGTFWGALQHVTQLNLKREKNSSTNSHPSSCGVDRGQVCSRGTIREAPGQEARDTQCILMMGSWQQGVKTCAEQCPSTGLESEIKPRGRRAAALQWCQTHLPFRTDLKYSLNHTLNFYRYIKSLPRVFIMLHWSILLFLWQENHFLL